MIYATKIKMKPGSLYSNDLLEIDQIYIAGTKIEGYYSMASVYLAVKEYPGSIKVNIPPYPDLLAGVTVNGEKFVRSEPDELHGDILLCLSREE